MGNSEHELPASQREGNNNDPIHKLLDIGEGVVDLMRYIHEREEAALNNHWWKALGLKGPRL